MHLDQRQWRVHSRAEHGPGAGSRTRVEPVGDVLRDADVTTVFLQGELDLATASEVRLLLEEECSRRPAKLVVDLSAVEFIDSSGLNLLVATHRRLSDEGCLLVVASPSETVWRTLALTRLDETLLLQRTPATDDEGTVDAA